MMKRELQPSGYVTYSSPIHDDMVMAVAMAVWCAWKEHERYLEVEGPVAIVIFGNPAVEAEAWTTFLEGPAEEVRLNAGRRAVPYNRVAWSVPVVTLRAGSPPG